MANFKLNESQVAVLNWIRQGCPEGVYESGYTHRSTARALEARGLVKIRGHGSTWRAEITESGRAWTPAETESREAKRQSKVPARPPAPVKSAPKTRPTETPRVDPEELLANVTAAGGSLDLPGDANEADYTEAVRRSRDLAVRPRGKRLELANAGSYLDRRMVVRLVDYFEDLVDPEPMHVLERAGKYHPLVREFLDHRPNVAVTKPHRARAARILQALIRALTAVGSTVGPETERRSHEGIRANAYRLSVGTPEGHNFVLHIGERIRRVTHDIPEERRRYSWPRPIEYEYIPTGELIVGIAPVRFAATAHTLKDGKRARVEDRLPILVRTLRVEEMYLQQRAEQVEKERRARQRRWELAMEEARAEYAADYERKHISSLARQWEDANRLRDFATAIEASSKNVNGVQAQQIAVVLSRVHAAADAVDPVAHPESVLCDVPDPRPEDLKPFLNGMNPYRPT